MKPIPTVRLLCEIFMSTNGSPLKSPGAVGTRFIGPIGTLTSEYYDRLKTAKEKKYSKYILAEKKSQEFIRGLPLHAVPLQRGSTVCISIKHLVGDQ